MWFPGLLNANDNAPVRTSLVEKEPDRRFCRSMAARFVPAFLLSTHAFLAVALHNLVRGHHEHLSLFRTAWTILSSRAAGCWLPSLHPQMTGAALVHLEGHLAARAQPCRVCDHVQDSPESVVADPSTEGVGERTIGHASFANEINAKSLSIRMQLKEHI